MAYSALLPVILSGGSGTRLWPLSRETHPKQLIALTGQHSLLQQTALRLNEMEGPYTTLPPLVVCNDQYRFITAEQLQTAGVTTATILLEPFGRNTAPALTLAALHAIKDDHDPILLVMPADHIIGDSKAFHAAIICAAQAVTEHSILTFGIVPQGPETGYGYLQVTDRDEDGLHDLQTFIEKPDALAAQEYIASAAYLWNSGLFMMRASVWLKAVAHFNPTIFAACVTSYEGAICDSDFIRIDSLAFESCPSDSIDYTVMEKLNTAPELGLRGRVVPLTAKWSDVGAWSNLWQVLDKDTTGNVTSGEVLLENSTDTLVLSHSRLVACIGLDQMVIIETPDALLVAHKDHTQDVKKIVSRLKKTGHTLANTHRKVYRPWGWYDSIDNGERFQVKRIVVKPGATLSLQMHYHRAEHWIVVRGTAEITNGESVRLLSENESTYIPLGHVHRLANPGKVPLEIIEVQSGSYLGEDDIVRFEDTYGRIPDQQN